MLLFFSSIEHDYYNIFYGKEKLRVDSTRRMRLSHGDVRDFVQKYPYRNIKKFKTSAHVPISNVVKEDTRQYGMNDLCLPLVLLVTRKQATTCKLRYPRNPLRITIINTVQSYSINGL
jgi:hypothetical protein